MPKLRSATSTQGRRMAGARGAHANGLHHQVVEATGNDRGAFELAVPPKRRGIAPEKIGIREHRTAIADEVAPYLDADEASRICAKTNKPAQLIAVQSRRLRPAACNTLSTLAQQTSAWAPPSPAMVTRPRLSS